LKRAFDALPFINKSVSIRVYLPAPACTGLRPACASTAGTGVQSSVPQVQVWIIELVNPK